MTPNPHEITICVARSDEPEDAYFWRCSCGRVGPLTTDQHRAAVGGTRHVSTMARQDISNAGGKRR